jgi:hypothetical protein
MKAPIVLREDGMVVSRHLRDKLEIALALLILFAK